MMNQVLFRVIEDSLRATEFYSRQCAHKLYFRILWYLKMFETINVVIQYNIISVIVGVMTIYDVNKKI